MRGAAFPSPKHGKLSPHFCEMVSCVELSQEPKLEPRTKTGSAENPITKLFPAAITEQRFIEKLDNLLCQRSTVDYEDDRESGHTLIDFTLTEGKSRLPVNVKNAETRF